MAILSYEKRMEQVNLAFQALNEVVNTTERREIEYAILKSSPNHGDINFVRLERLILNIANNYGKYDEIKMILKDLY